MKQGIIKKTDLEKLFDSLGKDGSVYGPVRRGSIVSLAEISSIKDLSLNYSNLKLSLKNFFSPQSEIIFVQEEEGERSVKPDEKKTVVFGTRPCDARAVLKMDKVFENDIIDPFFSARRNNATIISRACDDPSSTCFCTSLGGSPSGKEGSDILSYDLNESLLFEAVTEKGNKLMETHSSVFHPVEKIDIKARDDLISRADEKLKEIDVSGISEKLDNLFDSVFWNRIFQTCLGCGVCTYLCPTCHCFSFYDEKLNSQGNRSQGERIRCWDSCQYSAFTMEASGHNPRVLGGERIRQRIMHKFNYFNKTYGESACVGCGRCIDNCPANLDLREMITEMREES